MATASPLCLITPRDHDLFEALDRSPLTVRQLLKLSTTFAYPFTTERRVQERLQRLVAAGRVRRWPYATAGRGILSYSKLTPLGYRLLHGHDALPTGRKVFRRVGVARQTHTHSLAEALVHLFVGARAAGVPVENFRRENTLRLHVGDESLYPDAAFELHPDAETRFLYFVEVDNRSESVWPGSAHDSWGKKVQFYERYQDATPQRFRVLMFTTGGPARLGNMLHCAATLARNPDRSLVYGIGLDAFLNTADPLQEPCFLNHQEKATALLTQTGRDFAVDLGGGRVGPLPAPVSRGVSDLTAGALLSAHPRPATHSAARP